ncbi:hypothetical protein HMPREF1572_00638 [Gardnerella vaginalis JCP7275]|nr:hypothetical protein HMPREF1572_00638 [Gardnerella vaginalis JCP7275]
MLIWISLTWISLIKQITKSICVKHCLKHCIKHCIKHCVEQFIKSEMIKLCCCIFI